MKRLGLAVPFVAGFLAAGSFTAVVVAETTTSSTTSTETTATATTATTATVTTATVTTATTPTTTTAPAPPALVPPRVRVAGIEVGGLSPSAAAAAIRTAFAAPLPLVVDRSRFELDPAKLATAYVDGAVARARAARPGAKIDLVVAVRGSAVRALSARLAKRYDRDAVDAELSLRNGRPVITRDRAGRVLDRGAVTRALVHALHVNSRAPVRVSTKVVAPAVTRSSFAAVIVINRALNRLSLFHGMRPWRVFGVATGQSVYPTPRGRFEIVTKQRWPWWYPPASPWAAGEKPVPPGPGNPLGTRWLGLSAPGVGIHGTPDDASIGYSASHGCIRMHIPDAEWLFEHVGVGTTVFIV